MRRQTLPPALTGSIPLAPVTFTILASAFARFSKPIRQHGRFMKKQQLTLTLKNSIAELDTLYSQVESYGQSIGLTEKCVFEINLVLDELFTNIIEYAYPDKKEHLIKITLANKNKQLVLTVEDDGISFNPLQVEQPDTDCPCEDRQIGGLGLHLIRQIMSHMQYERRGRKNVLTLTKALEN